MTTCTIVGNSNMYGLGMRLSYYIQWYTTILSIWLAPTETDSLYLSTAFFVSATFLALLIQTFMSTPAPIPSLTTNPCTLQTEETNLKPVEIYIILLLTFGAYLALVPLYIIRLLTCCDGKWDVSMLSILFHISQSRDMPDL